MCGLEQGDACHTSQTPSYTNVKCHKAQANRKALLVTVERASACVIFHFTATDPDQEQGPLQGSAKPAKKMASHASRDSQGLSAESLNIRECKSSSSTFKNCYPGPLWG